MALATTLEAVSESAPPPGEIGLAPDAVTAELIRRHGAGEKLTPKEYGKLGAWKAKLAGKPLGRPPANGAPPAQSAAPAPLAPAGAPGQAQAPDGSAAPATFDPAVIRRTTEAILTGCDKAARNYLVAEARKAGADDKTARAFDEAAALPATQKEIIVATSDQVIPQMLAAIGMDPNNYAMVSFFGAMGLWGVSLGMAVSQLKTMQAEKARQQAPAPAPEKKP